MTSVGAWISGSRETVSWYTLAHQCAARPQGGRALAGKREGGLAEDGAELLEVREDRPRAARRRAGEHERADALGEADRELLGHHPAERGSEDVSALDVERVE
jgi:hypothetical protein